jgi:hypothetical protein
MTIEETERNFEFKVIKKAVRQQFPFIKDLIIDKDSFYKYDTLFVFGLIDVVEVYKTKGYKLNDWALLMPDTPRGISVIFDINWEQYNEEIRKPLEKMIEKIYFSDMIPENLRLKRFVKVFDYIIKPVSESEITPEMYSK